MIWIAAIAVIAVAAFFLLRRKHTALPSGWTADTDGNDYGTKVEADGSFDFPLAPNSVHYVTKECAGLAGTGIRLTYRIDADVGVTFHDAQRGTEITSGPILYFQRHGDDWSGIGQFESYRWWAMGAPGSLAPGEHTITAMFSDRWTAVATSNNIDQAQAFAAALAGASRVGFTFPNDTGAGHGIYASGKARFTLLEFTII